MKIRMFDEQSFGLVLASVENEELWGPSHAESHGLLVALCGRVVLTPPEWEQAKNTPGPGGLACRLIARRYQGQGLQALGGLNGNFAAIIADDHQRRIHIVTDPCGVNLVFANHGTQPRAFSSHPDVLAAALAEDQDLDLTSLAQFVMTGSVTSPHTYYRNLCALEPGCFHSVTLEPGPIAESPKPYFSFRFNLDEKTGEDDLAAELATNLKSAVANRTLPLLGRSTVALSGGLDSRAILSSVSPGAPLSAFTLYDQPNTETQRAREISAVFGLNLATYQRDVEYYGTSCEMGVRISGGLGSLASNHFLGVRDRIIDSGVDNFLTGCYCDYIFKGLGFNVQETGFLRKQRLAGFAFNFYRAHFPVAPACQTLVNQRLATLFPEHEKTSLSELDWLEIERKRVFPLAYEGDLAQRSIPQQVLPWYPPAVDRGLIATYLKIPPRFKLNSSVFRKMLTHLCPPEMLRIPDSNTGAPVNAGLPSLAFHKIISAVLNRAHKLAGPKLATRGSWPSRDFYVQNSKTIRALWTREAPLARDVLSQVMGHDPLKRDVGDYRGPRAQLFLRLLTAKVWLSQREAPHVQPSVPSALAVLQ